MRVLAITHRTPYPPDKGDKIRTWHLLSGLARRATVHLCAFAEPPADMAHAATLRERFASVDLVPLDLRIQKLLALPHLATLTPLTVPIFHRRALRRAVDRAVAELRPDALVAESTSMAPYALAHPELPLVMDFVDVDSAKWKAYVPRARGPEKLVYWREGHTLARYERHVARRATISTVTADRERVLLDAIAPGCDVRTLPNGVDTDYFAPRERAPAEPSVVFFGAMDYHANVDGALLLVREVLPKLRATHPTLRVVLAGSKPTREVQALAEVPGVTVTGYVNDMRPHVTGASVCVVPLRVARGVQNKVLEAMAMGVPVVATAAAAEGIDAEPGRDLWVAGDGDLAAGLAAGVLALLADPGRAEAMARSARACVEARYGWAPRAGQLHGMLEEAIRRRGRSG